MFFWNSFAFFLKTDPTDPTDDGNFISVFSAFSQSSPYTWKFSVHILLKPRLKDFEHYLASVWNECSCVVVEIWTIKKAEHWRIDAFELWCWRRLSRVLWTARRSNQSILKEISPEYSLERLIQKLKLQYFGHLMQRTDSIEKTLMLRKIEGGRGRGQQRMRWLDGITDWMQMSLRNSGGWWWRGRPGVLQSMGLQRVGHEWTALNCEVAQSCQTLCNPMNRSMPGLPVHHQLPEFTQTHVHWVGDAI